VSARRAIITILMMSFLVISLLPPGLLRQSAAYGYAAASQGAPHLAAPDKLTTAPSKPSVGRHKPNEKCDKSHEGCDNPTEVRSKPTEVREKPTEVRNTPTTAANTPTTAVDTPTTAASTPTTAVDAPTTPPNMPAETPNSEGNNRTNPSGDWTNPEPGFVATGPVLHLAAHAQQVGSDNLRIARVDFAATVNGAWRVVCQVSSPTRDDLYQCDWNLAGAGVSNGPLTLLFVVYDSAGNRNFQPDRIRQGVLQLPGTPIHTFVPSASPTNTPVPHASPTNSPVPRASPAAKPRRAVHPPTQPHRYVVLLDGIGSEDVPFDIRNDLSTRTHADHAVVQDFSVMRKRMQRELPGARFVYFSYALGPLLAAHQNPVNAWAACSKVPAVEGCANRRALPQRLFQEPSYSVDDTKRAHLQVHAGGLDWLLNQIVQQDARLRARSEIDLVGFSLGGVVASLWAATLANHSAAASHIHSVVLVESPVGGFPLANQVMAGCPPRDLICHAWFDWGLPGYFGKPVLADLKQTAPNANSSIVGALQEAAGRFDVTSIQSTDDYLVNARPVPICDQRCRKVLLVPVGSGTQAWNPRPLTAYDSTLLGGHLLDYALVNARATFGVLASNHRAPLRNDTTAEWVANALMMDGPRWLAHR
jgi:hypothetical protein